MHTTLLFLVELKGKAQGLGQDGLDFAPAFLWGEKSRERFAVVTNFYVTCLLLILKWGQSIMYLFIQLFGTRFRR